MRPLRTRIVRLGASLATAGLLAGGCTSAPPVPASPIWTDVRPVLDGSCNGCHGPTAPVTGGGYRFDFFDAGTDVCGDAALALDPNVILAGSALATGQFKSDLLPQAQATWPRMPPQPSPALFDWERDTLLRWAAQPVKGPAPIDNAPPTVAVSQFPLTAKNSLAFTAVLADPNDDAVLGVVEAGGFAYRMAHAGAFAVAFDTSGWPAGPQDVNVTLCDGWSSVTIPLGAVQIQH